MARAEKAVHAMASSKTLHRAERVNMVLENGTRASHAEHAGHLAEEEIHPEGESADSDHGLRSGQDTASSREPTGHH